MSDMQATPAYLLDTNIPSELIRSRPNYRVNEWVRGLDQRTLWISVITLGELRRGFELAREPERRAFLENWFTTTLLPEFTGRILGVTQAIAERWGTLDAIATKNGTPLETADGLIAATALTHGLVVVTRNVRDFTAAGVTIFDPWTL